MQPFCPAISWTWHTPLESGRGETSLVLWSHSHYCCTHPEDFNKHNRRAPCLAAGMFHSRSLFPFIPILTLKINAIYCCPFAKKEKAKARKKREENGKTSRKLHNRNASVINFKKKIHSITSQKIIWKIKNRPCQQQWEQPQQQQQRWRRQQQKRKAKSKKAEHSTKSRVIYAPPRELCAEQNRQCVSSPTPHHPVPFLTNRAPAPYPSGNWNAQYKGRECGRCSSQEARLQICLKQAFHML